MSVDYPLAERIRPTDLLKLHCILRKREGWRIQEMSEFDSKISGNILALLEGEEIRVILRDGTAVEGVVARVSAGELILTDRAIPLDEIATYYVLKQD
jgi:hypothetical protein